MLKRFAISPVNIIQQPFNSIQQNRTDVETNVEAIWSGLKNVHVSSLTVTLLLMGYYAFFKRVSSSGKKRKRKNVDEDEADYEKRPRTAPADQDHNERTLLPIKSKDSIIPRKEKLPLTGALYSIADMIACMQVPKMFTVCMYL